MNAPYYQDDSATLYGGDSLAVLCDLPSASVDAVITDPPYSSGGMVRGDRVQETGAKYLSSGRLGDEGDFAGDNRDQRAYAYWSALWLSEAMRVTRTGGVVLMFTDWRQLPATSDALQAGGWVWRGIVPWAKSFGARGARPMAGRFAVQCEYVVWGSRGGMPVRMGEDACLPGFYQGNAPREREHQTQKPMEVMRELVKICPEGGVILDPFMGSGTTGVAAMAEGRRFVGVEMVEHYQAISQRRIQEARGLSVPRGDQDAFDFGSAS